MTSNAPSKPKRRRKLSDEEQKSQEIQARYEFRRRISERRKAEGKPPLRGYPVI